MEEEEQTINLPIVNPTCAIVNTLIGTFATSILEQILDCCNSQDKEYWDHGHLLPKGIDGRKPVQKDNEYEVQIGHTMELLEEILRYEGEQSVLGSTYLIAGEETIGMIPFRSLGRNGVIWHNDTIAAFLRLLRLATGDGADSFPPWWCVHTTQGVDRFGT